jgi:hypothetical protein
MLNKKMSVIPVYLKGVTAEGGARPLQKKTPLLQTKNMKGLLSVPFGEGDKGDEVNNQNQREPTF